MKLYHYGFVVDDIETAMEVYAAALDLEWSSVVPRDVRVVVDGAEPVDVRLLAAYSRGGAPHVELIQELEGDVWSRGARGLHHLGYWVTDLDAEFDRLRECGMDSSVRCVDDAGVPQRFSYQRASSVAGGPWVELVDETVRPQLMAWIGGGAYDL